jgi:Flp pilus assembly protein TadG
VTDTTRVPSLRRDEGGQSLVEVALTLPLLLLIVIGIVDVGRVYAFEASVTNAAREAAAYAARDPQATADAICQRARDELRVGGSGCATADLTITCTRVAPIDNCGNETMRPVLYQTPGQAGSDITVTVTYSVPLLTGYLVGRVFTVNPVNISATAWFPGLSQ